jgi:hypothetical protein
VVADTEEGIDKEAFVGGDRGASAEGDPCVAFGEAYAEDAYAEVAYAGVANAGVVNAGEVFVGVFAEVAFAEVAFVGVAFAEVAFAGVVMGGAEFAGIVAAVAGSVVDVEEFVSVGRCWVVLAAWASFAAVESSAVAEDLPVFAEYSAFASAAGWESPATAVPAFVASAESGALVVPAVPAANVAIVGNAATADCAY